MSSSRVSFDRILLIKAQQKGASEVMGDLFEEKVPVKGHMRASQEGGAAWASRHEKIPLDAIFTIVKAGGYVPVDEAGEPWTGIIAGAKGRTTIDLKKNGKYSKLALQLQWERMPSGRYEINAYLS